MRQLDQEKAFTEMIIKNEALIFKITTIYGNSEDDRKDLYQEIVLQLWKSFKKYRKEAKLSTWIYRLALNTAISSLRKEKNAPKTAPFKSDIHFLADSQDTLLEERSKSLYASISQLNSIEKAIILLFLEDKNHSEIAQITGISVSNVSTRLVRIRQKLKEKIIKV
jgi:RNA polymerase sigma factor (sigma-70 family)